MSACAFTALALLLAGPVQTLLARAAWPMRAPRAALVLWQSIALAAALSAFSAGLALTAATFTLVANRRPTADIASVIGTVSWPLWVGAVLGLAASLVIGFRLTAAVLTVAIGTRRRRARHRMMVDLVGACGDNDVRVVGIPTPMAYCLPGRRSRVVLSQGALAALSQPELVAILRHERAHLRARHDLVLEAFIAAHTAFPRIVRSGSALSAVRLLVEMLADDAAVRAAGPGPLARALVACAAAPTPAGALAAGGPSTVLRIRRLAGRPNSSALAAAAYLAAAAVLVLPTVAVAVPWLTDIHRLFSP